MMSGIAFTGVSLFLVGPSKLLHLPVSLPLMIVGQAIMGFALPFIYIQALPEMTSAVQEDKPKS